MVWMYVEHMYFPAWIPQKSHEVGFVVCVSPPPLNVPNTNAAFISKQTHHLQVTITSQNFGGNSQKRPLRWLLQATNNILKNGYAYEEF